MSQAEIGDVKVLEVSQKMDVGDIFETTVFETHCKLKVWDVESREDGLYLIYAEVIEVIRGE
jgi:hypothetical protein